MQKHIIFKVQPLILRYYIFINLFLMSLQKYYYYWIPIGDQSETNWRPTCLIGDPLETDMPDWRSIRDRHA